MVPTSSISIAINAFKEEILSANKNCCTYVSAEDAVLAPVSPTFQELVENSNIQDYNFPDSDAKAHLAEGNRSKSENIAHADLCLRLAKDISRTTSIGDSAGASPQPNTANPTIATMPSTFSYDGFTSDVFLGSKASKAVCEPPFALVEASEPPTVIEGAAEGAIAPEIYTIVADINCIFLRHHKNDGRP